MAIFKINGQIYNYSGLSCNSTVKCLDRRKKHQWFGPACLNWQLLFHQCYLFLFYRFTKRPRRLSIPPRNGHECTLKGHYYETILRNFVVENTTERPNTSNLLRDNKFKVRRKHLATWLHKKQIWYDTLLHRSFSRCKHHCQWIAESYIRFMVGNSFIKAI